MQFYQLEPDGRLVFMGANLADNTILGFSHTSLTDKTFDDTFPSHVSSEIPEHNRSVSRTGQIWHTDQVDYNDELIRGGFSVWAFRIAPYQMTATFLDIAEIKKTQDALAEPEREYRTTFDNIQDLFYRTNA